MKKILSIIILGLFIGCSFGVQGLFFERTIEKITLYNGMSELNFENRYSSLTDSLF
jgi:hypothetical protein